MKGLPEEGQPINAVKTEELRYAVGIVSRTIELQIHPCGVSAKSKEDPLAEAEQTGEPPDQINAKGNDR